MAKCREHFRSISDYLRDRGWCGANGWWSHGKVINDKVAIEISDAFTRQLKYDILQDPHDADQGCWKLVGITLERLP